jgi:Na+/melibiose symporter-like transporter
MLHGSMKLRDRLTEMRQYSAELAAVLAVVFLSVIVNGTRTRSWPFSLVVALSLVGAAILFVIIFVMIIRGFRDQPAGVREIRDSLVSSYLAALDRTSLNPATQPPIQVPLRRHFDGDPPSIPVRDTSV